MDNMYGGNYNQYSSTRNSGPKMPKVNLRLVPAILVGIVAVYILIQGFNAVFGFLSSSAPSEVATATLVQGQANIELQNGFELKMIQGKDETFFEGEQITTEKDSFMILQMNGGYIVRVDEFTTLNIVQNDVTEKDVSAQIELTSGQIWVDVDGARTGAREYSVVVKSKRGISNISNARTTIVSDDSLDAIRVFGGGVEVSVLSDDSSDITETFNVGVGQQMFITNQNQKSLRIGQNPTLISAIADEYKAGTFYVWNSSFYNDQVNIPVVEESTDGEKGIDEGLVTVLSPREDQKFAKSLIEVTGTFLPGKVTEVSVNGKVATLTNETWKVTGVPVTQEGENVLVVEGKNPLGVIVYRNNFTVLKDLTPLPAPEITFPTEDRSIWANNRLDITGTVSPDTVAVEINDFRLTKYSPGQTEWKYIANRFGGNMKYGLNTYTVYAIDEAGNKSAPKVIYVYLRQPDEDITLEQAFGQILLEGDNAVTSDGRLNPPILIEPNAGRDFETAEARITLKGLVPDGTQQVKVNDFTLRQFKPGNKEFVYYAWAEYGTLVAGENVYNIYAIDKDGKASDPKTIKITYLPGGATLRALPGAFSQSPSR